MTTDNDLTKWLFAEIAAKAQVVGQLSEQRNGKRSNKNRSKR